MKEYSVFSLFYDRMMDNIPYDEWERYLIQLFYRFGVRACGKIAEIGCGTGNMTERLSLDGFQMTGVDISDEMLKQAQAKAGSDDIEYIRQDMRELKLREKQEAVLCVCDGMNYMRSVADMAAVMKAVKANLKDGGVFIFDLKTESFFKNELDGKQFKEKIEGCDCIWKNEYDEADRTHHYVLDFIKGGKIIGSEEHLQHVFKADEIKAAAKAADFGHAVAYEAFSFRKPRKNSKRIYIICGGK